MSTASHDNEVAGSVYGRPTRFTYRPGPMVTIGVVSLGVAALSVFAGFRLALPDSIAAYGFAGGLVLGLAALCWGMFLFRWPEKVIVGADVLTVVYARHTQAVPWEELLCASEGGVRNGLSYLSLLGKDGTFAVQIPAIFENVETMEAAIREGIESVPTPGPIELSLRGNLKMGLCYLGIALIAASFALYFLNDGCQSRVNAQRLQSEGTMGEGVVTRKYLAPNGTTTRIELEATGEGGRTGTRDMEIRPEMWEALEEGTRLPILYLPDTPHVLQPFSPNKDYWYPSPNALGAFAPPVIVLLLCIRLVMLGMGGLKRLDLVWDEAQQALVLRETPDT